MNYVILPWPPKELSPNARVHWAKKAKAAKKYRYDCGYLAAHARLNVPEGKVTVTFSPPNNRKRDQDNMIASLKSGIDGICDWMRIDDSTFDYEYKFNDSCGGWIRIDT